MENKKGTRMEYIGGGIKIIVADEYTFTLDSILLAEFSMPQKSDSVLEIGTGCGIIPLIWCRDSEANDITAVEIQKGACDIFYKSIIINSLNNRINLINGDIRNPYEIGIDNSKYNMIVCNPPYKKVGTGKLGKSEPLNIARYEIKLTIDELSYISSRLLVSGGTLCLCNRVERLCDIMCSMRLNGIEPKTIRFVQQTKELSASLFMLKGKKGARPGMKCLPALIIKNQNREYSDEVLELYKRTEDKEMDL